METIACSLCESDRSIFRYEVQDYLLDHLETKAYFYQCQNCGLIYQNPRPSLSEMSQYYPDDYLPFQADASNQSFLIRKAIKYGYQNRINNVTRFKKFGNLLDIGCGSGEFLEQFKTIKGWDLSGVEINSYAAKIAQKKGLNIFNGTLEEARFPDDSFDAVTMWDVLEHLHDPKQTLREVKRILKPGGIIALRLPNGDSWDLKLFKRYWSGLDAPRHLYVFTHKTIHQLLDISGFDILQMHSKQGSYIGFTLSLSFWLTAKNVPLNKRQSIMNALQSPIARIIAAPFFSIYGFSQHATQLIVSAAAR